MGWYGNMIQLNGRMFQPSLMTRKWNSPRPKWRLQEADLVLLTGTLSSQRGVNIELIIKGYPQVIKRGNGQATNIHYPLFFFQGQRDLQIGGFSWPSCHVTEEFGAEANWDDAWDGSTHGSTLPRIWCRFMWWKFGNARWRSQWGCATVGTSFPLPPSKKKWNSIRYLREIRVWKRSFFEVANYSRCHGDWSQIGYHRIVYIILRSPFCCINSCWMCKSSLNPGKHDRKLS